MVIRRSSHAVYDTQYHLVWCPKYRKDLFEQSYLRERANDLFYEIAEQYGFIIEEMEVANDHVHIFISFPPRYSISRVVGIMKSISARVLFREFPSIKKRLWNKELWEDGYFARTVGDKLTKDIIKKYIKHHKNQKQAPVQLDFELDD
jgi:putative transposase